MKYRSPDSMWYRFSNSRLALISLVALVVLVGYAVVRERKDRVATVKSVESLEQEIAELEDKSLELSAMIKYLRSDEFVEREAREKLNLQKPGEKVVIVPESELEIARVAGEEDSKNKRNWELWLEYFFGDRRM